MDRLNSAMQPFPRTGSASKKKSNISSAEMAGFVFYAPL